MARGQLINSIPALQLEWAIKYNTRSIRNYLIEVKGLTERQYRYVLKKAALDSWILKRTQIETKAQAIHIESYLDKVMKTTDNHLKAANLTLMKITSQIANYNPARQNPSTLLHLTRALAEAQSVAFKALGMDDQTVRRTFTAKEESFKNLKTAEPISEFEKINNAAARLDYDDIVDMLKATRVKRKALIASEPQNT